MADFAHLLPPSWKPQITAWLAEDTPSFDYGGYVVGEVQRTAYLLGKGSSEAVLAGVPFFTEVFNQLGCEYVLKSLLVLISHGIVFTFWAGWSGI